MFIDFTSSKEVSRNTLNDGRVSIAYGDVPGVYENIERMLSRELIDREQILGLECQNSVPVALVLLFLLTHGYNVYLYPKPRVGAITESLDAQLPSFCAYKVATDCLSADADLTTDNFLRIDTNQGGPRKSTGPSRLYLRTSGSTGASKVVVHSQGKLRRNVLNCVERLELDRNDRVAISVPIFHMYGLGAAFLPSVAVGACLDLQDRPNILTYLQREENFQPNIAFVTPTFCESIDRVRRSHRRYKLTVVAGDCLRQEAYWHHEAKVGTLVQLYGSTEMGALAAASPRDSAEDRAKSVGTPMTGVLFDVRERSAEGAQTDERIGELWCQSQNGFDGYADEHGIVGSEPAVGGLEWWNTRDLARLHPSGRLEVIGRTDHCVNRDGRLVSFSFIENILESEPCIDKAVVVSRGDGRRGKEIVVCCTPKDGARLTADDVMLICRRTLPKFAIPELAIVSPSLPMLVNGKVDRLSLSRNVTLGSGK